MGIGSIVFIILILGGFGFFGMQVMRIAGNIKMGKDVNRKDKFSERLKTMTLVALGQKKMFQRPIPAILHMFIYVAFLFTQVELIEIIIDGVSGSHRIFHEPLGGFYTLVISIIEVLSFLALIATFSFLARRNLLKIPRFHMDEMKGWPKLDGNIILYLEFFLVMFIFTMNGADEALYQAGHSHAAGAHGEVGSYGFALSSLFGGAIFGGMETSTLELLERIGWWGHIITVLAFMCYLPFSKHFHIFLAFPNTFFSNLNKKGQFTNLPSVKKEVESMFDPNFDPYAAPPEGEVVEVSRFGAKDVEDLTWKQLMDSYTCTECGRCSSSCPASQTGKKLSPRKIVMDTRDRLEELSAFKKKNGKDQHDGKSLLFDFVTEEEVWACTSCNACVEACPVNIDPLGIIVDLRRYLVMEESKVPSELATMLTNIENNGAPWQFSPTDRLNWAKED